MNAQLPPPNHQISAKKRRMILAGLLGSGLSLLPFHTWAQISPGPNTQIINKAFGSFDSDGGGTTVVESNEVIVTIAEVAGVSVDDNNVLPTEAPNGTTGSGIAQGNGALNPDDVIFFTFRVNNLGNDPSQFFIPGTPAQVINGSFDVSNIGPVQIIGYDVDGDGAAAIATGLSVPVPEAGGLTSDLNIPGLASGSFAPNGFLLVQVPIKADLALGDGDSVSVLYGDTGSNDNTATAQNQPYSPSSITPPSGVPDFGGYDIFTQDNPGTTQGDTNGDPANGDPSTHRQEASYRQTVTVVINDDFGDAPDSYGAASHRTDTTPPLFLGNQSPDPELQSQNAANGGSDGLGDDDATAPNLDDEDGIELSSIVLGRTSYQLNSDQITATGTGTLHAWIDFDQNGSFDSDEYQSTPIVNGTANDLTWSGLSGLVTGTTYARFRLTTDTLADNVNTTADERAVGAVSDGEVEDYPVAIAPIAQDFGDAPNDLTSIDAALINIYPSASHDVDNVTFLGSTVDSEAASQPTVNADGDDLTGAVDDEDGVSFSQVGTQSVLFSGQTNSVTITASTNGILNAWIDWNQDGDWDDTDEQIATNIALTSGNNTLSFAVPNTAPHGQTYSRFRFSTQADLTPSGPAPNGEVEDYSVNIALPAPVACNAGILNDGFENPVIGTGSPLQTFSAGQIVSYREADVPWWGTIANQPDASTGFDNRNALELWRNGTASGGQTFDSFEGEQFAEVNANVTGRLYQDLAVPPGTEIRWQVAHRGRAGTDEMGVYLGPPGNETNQGIFATPNTEWRVYSGIYVVPANQFITRFAIQAENTSGGAESSVGNFVDDVRLTNFCAPSVRGFKSLLLTADNDNNNLISPGDNLTYSIFYINELNGTTGPAGNFQINDLLPDGLSITAAGAQTITASGGDTRANINPNYTGATAGAESDLFGTGALLDVGGVINVEIPVVVDNDASGTISNQGISRANEFLGTFILTDNVDDTTTGLPNGVVIPTGSHPQNQVETSIDPTRFTIVTSNDPNILLVKRISGVQDDASFTLQTTNPHDGTPLDQVINAPQSIDDDHPGWPTDFLVGAIDGGITEFGDDIEYTIYFLSSGTIIANDVVICDRIPTHQTFVADSFSGLPQGPGGSGGGLGIQVLLDQPGLTGDESALAYTNNADGDIAQFFAPGESLPSACGPDLNDNGAIVVNLGDLPQSNGPGTPSNALGYVRFRAQTE